MDRPLKGELTKMRGALSNGKYANTNYIKLLNLFSDTISNKDNENLRRGLGGDEAQKSGEDYWEWISRIGPSIYVIYKKGQRKTQSGKKITSMGQTKPSMGQTKPSMGPTKTVRPDVKKDVGDFLKEMNTHLSKNTLYILKNGKVKIK